MRRWLIFGIVAGLCAASGVERAHAESDARQRQAAAEMYDLGTASYLAGDFEKAAEWFETANRMSPAAPALQQAARSHYRAGNLARAASLALRLSLEYPDDADASAYAQGVLDELGGQFLRVDVVCEGCRLQVDGALQEFNSFYVEADSTHSIVASFDEGGEATLEVSGGAGETQTLPIEVPATESSTGTSTHLKIEPSGPKPRPEAEPLPPIVTYIGVGLTGALLVGSIASTVDVYSGVDPYEKAVDDWEAARDARSPDTQELFDKAKEKLDDGQAKEGRTTALWVATAAVGVATGVIALFLTDWGGDDEASDVAIGVTPLPGGAYAGMEGRF